MPSPEGFACRVAHLATTLLWPTPMPAEQPLARRIASRAETPCAAQKKRAQTAIREKEKGTNLARTMALCCWAHARRFAATVGPNRASVAQRLCRIALLLRKVTRSHHIAKKVEISSVTLSCQLSDVTQSTERRGKSQLERTRSSSVDLRPRGCSIIRGLIRIHRALKVTATTCPNLQGLHTGSTPVVE